MNAQGSVGDLYLNEDSIGFYPQQAPFLAMSAEGVGSGQKSVTWSELIGLRLESFRDGPTPGWALTGARIFAWQGAGRNLEGRSRLLMMRSMSDEWVHLSRPRRKYSLAEALAAEAFVAWCFGNRRVPPEAVSSFQGVADIARNTRWRPWACAKRVREFLDDVTNQADPRRGATS